MNENKANTQDDKNTGVEVPSAVPPIAHPGHVSDPQHRKSRALHAIFPVLVAGVVGFGGGWLGAASQDDNASSTANTQRIVLGEQSQLISKIAGEVGQSVVSVNVTSQVTAGNFGFFGGPRSAEQQSAGTGIIISDDGLIITNRHVVPEGTTKVSVTLSDGTELNDVEVVGRTSDNDSLDIAFLKVRDTKGHKLAAAKLGSSSKMKVGDSVIAIGNALGQFQNTVTTGILSGYGRSVQASDSSGSSTENLDDLFQTDAAINEGNSGGPLVNLNGEVVGINTAIAGGAQNIGFAIPIDNVSGLVKNVKDGGKLERPYMGVVYVTLTDDIAKQYNLKVTRGAYIPKSSDYGQTTVISGSPAAKAGIKEGDVITKVDNTAITQNVSLTSLLGKHEVGDTIKVTVNRDGQTKTFDVALAARPTS
jgi:serine protease Do